MFIFLFWSENTLFLDKFGPKNHDCLFKMKLGFLTNSNMLNLMMMFTLSVLDRKYHFWANFIQKMKTLFKMKDGTYTNFNMVNLMVMSICPLDFRQERPFLGKFAQKNQKCLFKLKVGTEINYNMLNSVVIFICPALNGKCFFWVNFVQKFKIPCLRWIFVKSRLIQICWIRWWYSDFLSWSRIPFWKNLVQKDRIVLLRWNLMSRLIKACWIWQ